MPKVEIQSSFGGAQVGLSQFWWKRPVPESKDAHLKIALELPSMSFNKHWYTLERASNWLHLHWRVSTWILTTLCHCKLLFAFDWFAPFPRQSRQIYYRAGWGLTSRLLNAGVRGYTVIARGTWMTRSPWQQGIIEIQSYIRTVLAVGNRIGN
jgi:hypothetical protein